MVTGNINKKVQWNKNNFFRRGRVLKIVCSEKLKMRWITQMTLRRQGTNVRHTCTWITYPRNPKFAICAFIFRQVVSSSLCYCIAKILLSLSVRFLPSVKPVFSETVKGINARFAGKGACLYHTQTILLTNFIWFVTKLFHFLYNGTI